MRVGNLLSSDNAILRTTLGAMMISFSAVLDEKTAADYGVDVTPRLEVVKTSEPEARAAGIIVGSVDELVEKLKEAGAV